MDLELTVEQRAVVETTRTFVQRELVPHEDEVERSGVLDPGLLRRLRDTAIRAGLYAANMPEDVGGGGLDTLDLDAHGTRARPHRLRAADARRRPAVPDPAGLRGRPARELPAAGGGRRAHRVPRDDRAGGGLGPARHAHPRGPRRRRLADHGDQALHQPRRRGRLRDPLRRDRGAAGRRRAPPREITAFLVDIDAPGLTVLPGYRSVSHRGYEQLGAGLRRLPGAGVGGAGRGRARLRRGHHLAGHDPPAGRGELPGPGAPRARPGRPRTRRPGASSAGRSAATREWRSSSPT